MSVKRNTAFNLVGSIVPIILSLATVPIYLQLVGPERYGVLAIAWLLLGYFGLLDLGFGRATSYRVAALSKESPDTRARAFWSALAVNAAMGLVGAALLYALGGLFFAKFFKVAPALRGELFASLPWLALSVPVATVTGVLVGALQGRQRFLDLNISSTLSTILFQLFPLGLAWMFGPHLGLLLAGALAARAIAMAVMGARCYAEIAKGQPIAIDRDEMREMFKYGGWVNLTSLAAPMLYMVDRFMIGAALGAAAVTDYSVPFQLATRAAILPSALTTALFPRLSSGDAAERDKLGRIAALSVAGLLGPVFIGGVFVMGPFLHYWVGRHLGPDAAWVGRLMLISMWANAAALVSLVQLQSSGRPDLVTKIMLFEIPPYLALLFVLMKLFGLPGAAAAAAIRSFADYGLLTWMAGRRFNGLICILANTGLLIAAALLSSRWPDLSWQWWASAAVLASISTAIGLKTLPPHVLQRLAGGRLAFIRRRD